MTPQNKAPKRPGPLLAGFFVGFASVALTSGVFGPFAPLFPALVAAVSALIPVKRHFAFAIMKLKNRLMPELSTFHCKTNI